MGLGGISIWQLVIVLVIVVLLFGTKKIRSLGGDLGGAIKSFKRALDDAEGEPQTTPAPSALRPPSNEKKNMSSDPH